MLIAWLCFLCFVNLRINASPIFPQSGAGMFGDKFQGDIKLTKQQEQFLSETKKGGGSKTGWTWLPYRWPTNDEGHAIVSYSIDESEGFLEDEIQFILDEFHIIEATTCIRFVRRTTENNFLNIINGEGCWAWMGMIGGMQEMSLDRNSCLTEGTPIHEAIHALGYDHMQNHIDRDEYVDIKWENIYPGFEFNFEKVDPQWFDNFDTPYDLLSVMHYPRWAFSKNGYDVVVPHNIDYIDKIGSKQISDGDIFRLRRMYNCPY